MMVRISLALTLAVIAALVHLLSREREGRLFLTPIGRALDASDHARTRLVQRVNLGAVLLAIGVLFATDSEHAILAGMLIATLVPALVMVLQLRLALRGTGGPLVPSRFVVPLSGGAPGLGELVSWPLQLLNVALLAAGTAGFLAILPTLPEEVPMHWNVLGKVDRVGHPRELWILLVMAAFDTALLLGFAWAAARERWVLPPTNAERYAELAREKRRLAVRLLEVIILVVNASMMLTWLIIALGAGQSARDLGGVVALIVAPLSTLAVMVALAVFLPHQMAVGDELRALGGGEALGTHPSGWRWGGTVYFAPDDPALLVPKRSGLGQTLNFARPSAWLLLGAILLAPLAILALVAVTR